MLILLIILSLLPKQSSSNPLLEHLHLRDDCQCSDRTLWEIVWPCLFTMFTCLWIAAHPNIPGPDETGWMIFRRRFQMMISSFIAPELTVLWAMRQAVNARGIADSFNKARGHPEPPDLSMCRILLEMFFEAIEAVKVWFRGHKRDCSSSRFQWTMTHGFFVQMGGFMLYRDHQPLYTLDYEELEQLIILGDIDVPMITEAQIADKSKGDFLSKSVVILQTLWFIVQCAARWKLGLPLTELEVVTLAFAALNWFTYAVWWYKPQNVQTPVPVYLKTANQKPSTKLEDGAMISGSDSGDNSGVEIAKENDSVMENGKQRTPQPRGRQGPPPSRFWLVRRISEDYDKCRGKGFLSFLRFIFWKVPDRILYNLLRPYEKMAFDDSVISDDQRVPMYYAQSMQKKHLSVIVWIIIFISMVFGGLHCLAWTSYFPSRVQLWLWRVSCLVMIFTAPVLWLTAIVSEWVAYTTRRHLGIFGGQAKDYIYCALFTMSVILLPNYFGARVFVLVQSFISLRTLPPATFQTIEWLKIIPHIW